MDDFSKINDEEKIWEYVKRLAEIKDVEKLTWQMIADYANKNYGVNYNESTYRRHIKVQNPIYTEDEKVDSALYEKMLELEKLKVQVRDQRMQTNASIRAMSREDTIKNIAHEYAELMNKEKLLNTTIDYNGVYDISKSAILTISDWHYGINIDNPYNKFSPEIARRRITDLLVKTVAYCQKEEVNEIYVVNLSDLIAGRIHLQLRVNSQEDVISQVMDVAEILAEFLNDLSKKFVVHYADCDDNHSRIEPNKKESIQLETLTRIITWYLKERVKNVDFIDNIYGDDIVAFNVGDYFITGVHGDKDKETRAIHNLTMMTRKVPDLVLTAHKHHFSAEEENEAMRISNGSLMGTDEYASDLRLTSKASQNLIIVSDKSVCECIYRIVLN